jgi:protein-L-isoaspartate(D-aspartate) O-methyltransferase
MLRQIEAHARNAASFTGCPVFSARVLTAMGRVARHAFVPASERDRAYVDGALPIGDGQTISQPYIVALMTELAEIGETARVLEVGTGSGYQSAVLAELAAEVYTIERIGSLADRARQTLASLGYTNVSYRVGDGYAGWPEQAPFDAILVTAAAREIPPPLEAQLGAPGRLVVPIGGEGFRQELLLVERTAEGTISRRQILPVAFVPLRRDRARPGSSGPSA